MLSVVSTFAFSMQTKTRKSSYINWQTISKVISYVLNVRLCKVVTLSLVQINLCLVAYTLNYVLNMS